MTRHPFDPLSFTAGVAFVGLAIAFLVGGGDVLEHAHWIWPTLLLAVGAAGLLATLRRDDPSEG